MKQFFSSLKAGYLFFALTALIFAAGNRLASIKEYNAVFKEMTATQITNCLDAIISKPLILIWLIFFILIGVCLFVNTWYCTQSQFKLMFQVRKHKKTAAGQSDIMVWIHIVALVAIACHALDITLIHRHQPVRIYAGETVQMGDHRIRVQKILYTADRSMITEDETTGNLKKTRIRGKNFSIKNNFAVVEIQKGQDSPLVKELRMLSPARIGSTFFFLDGFFIAQGETRIGVKIHHSNNPLALVFFAVYTILFILLGILFFTTRWKGKGGEH